MLSVVNNDEAGAEGRFGLDEICREGARTIIVAASELDVDAYLAELVDERDKNGHRLVTVFSHHDLAATLEAMKCWWRLSGVVADFPLAAVSAYLV